jgi:transposase-like protein
VREGVSTRKVKDATEELCGTSLSKSLVSHLVGQLDAEHTDRLDWPTVDDRKYHWVLDLA